MTAITCGDRMFTRPPLLTEPSDCRDFARYLDGFGNDDRVDAEYITGAVSASTPCEVCQEHGCVGQVHVSWLPRGCDRVTIKTGDDVLGSATLAKGATSARISDGEKLLAWVAERYPEQIITERRIRSAVTARIIAQSKAAGQPVYDGELDVPGITVSVGEPKLQLRAEDDAAVVIERLWQAGEIDLRVLLALPGGE
jgi:hypothetical protein